MPYSSEHKEKSRQRIIKSATDLFCRYGFDKVSITQVMKLAKMTHGAFYSHFESKEALYKESFRRALESSRATRLIKGPFTIKHLKNLVTGYLNLRDLDSQHLESQQAPDIESFLANDIANENFEVKRLYEQSYFTMLGLLEKRLFALKRLKKSPLNISTNNIPDTARVILASLIGAIAIAKSISQEAEREAIMAASQKQIFSLLGIDYSRYGLQF